MQKIFLISLISCAFLFGCRSRKTNNKPIAEEKLIHLLVDIHLADATLSAENIYAKRGKYLPSYYYNSIYKKHGITAAEFDSCIAYYSRTSDKFDKLYEKVIDSLNRLETKLKIELQNSPEKQDTINLWEQKTNWEFPKDKFSELRFNIPVTEKGIYTISAEIKLYKDDQTEKPKMEAYFWKYDGTPKGERVFFDTVPLLKDDTLHYYEAELELTDTTFSFLKGAFLSGENMEQNYSQHAEVKNIMIFNPRIKTKTLRLTPDDFIP